MSTMTDLAALVGGTVHAGDRIATDHGLVYASFHGKVRLDLHGRVIDLGTHTDGPDRLAMAFWGQVLAATPEGVERALVLNRLATIAAMQAEVEELKAS